MNGMRFLLALRKFAVSRATQGSNTVNANGAYDQAAPVARMQYRALLWAYHSESQDILLTSCTTVLDKPILWRDARALGLAIWVKSKEALVSWKISPPALLAVNSRLCALRQAAQLDVIARNEYTSQEDRDPTNCSLLYFALRKKRLVQGLWRQATHHKERSLMMKFLMNDFDTPRWKSAAMKNAYALMSKQRPGMLCQLSG